ncbi:MAG: hypothetical protein R3F22_05915 [Lysobacteraceae bacterium]
MTKQTDDRAAVAPPRITARAFIREMSAKALDLDRGVLHTFVSLCASPGQTLRRWIILRDPRLTRPFRYFLVLVALSLLLQAVFGLNDFSPADSTAGLVSDAKRVQQASDAGQAEAAIKGTERIASGVLFLRTKHRELLMLMVIPFAAFGLWCAHRRERWYFAEYWVALTYTYATSYFLQSLLEILLTPFTASHLVISRIAMYSLIALMLVRLHPRPLPGAVLRTLTGFTLAAICLFVFIILLALLLTATSRFN